MTGKRGKTPPDEELMPDPTSTGPERAAQFWFILRTLAGCVLLVFAIDNWHFELTQIPDRTPLPPTAATLQLEPIGLFAEEGGPLRVAGAWEVTGDDPRIGGVSGLAVDGERLIALNDSGSIIVFAKPAGGLALPAMVKDLPAGPSTPTFNAHRDSEALVRDPRGRGWWVSFESINHFWLYGPGFGRALQRIRHGARVVSYGNKGFEAAAADGEDVVFFAEGGEVILRLGRGDMSLERVIDPGGPISEAASIRPGRVLAIERRLTPFGFRNRLAILEKRDGGFERTASAPIPAGPLDNFEALAIDRSGGRTRLWLMTDDSFSAIYRTVLMAVDVDRKWLDGA